MGVTLHYHGILSDPNTVSALITEMSDIAIANNWKYQVLDDPWDSEVTLQVEHQGDVATFTGNAGLKGVIVSVHPESEGLSLLFDHAGVTRSLLDMTLPPEKRIAISQTKTQYAGIDVHIKLVHLLEYVGKKYMREWRLEDDSGYLKHRDRDRALEVFHLVGDAINALTEAFDTIDIPDEIKNDENKVIAMIEDRIKTYLPGAEIMRVEEEE